MKKKITCLLFVLLFLMTYSLSLSETIFPSSHPFIQSMLEEIKKEDSILYDAVYSGIFLTHDEWRLGFVSKDKKIIVNILLSGNEKDAVILSGRVMIKRDVQDPWNTACDIHEYIRKALSFASKEYGIQYYPITDNIFIFADPFDHDFDVSSFVILDDQLDAKQKTDIYGNDQQMKRYCIEQEKEETNGACTVNEFVEKYLPNVMLDNLEQYRLIRYDEEFIQQVIDGMDFTEEEVEAIRAQFRKSESKDPAYVFPYKDNLFVEVDYNPDTEEIYEWGIRSTEMGYKELLRAYLKFFWEVSNISLPEETIELLIYRNGEEFTWRDAIGYVNYPQYVWDRIAYVSDGKWYAWIDGESAVPELRFGFVKSMESVEYNAWGRLHN